MEEKLVELFSSWRHEQGGIDSGQTRVGIILQETLLYNSLLEIIYFHNENTTYQNSYREFCDFNYLLQVHLIFDRLKHMFNVLEYHVLVTEEERTHCFTLIELPHEISNNVAYATSKASDQPAHTHRLIRAFASRLNSL